MSHDDIITGTVERVVYHNQENGFAIFTMQLAGSTSVTVKAHMPAIHEGEHVQAQGAWITHPKFGRQFDARSCSTTVPTSLVGIKKYLASGLIKGIGPVYADKLVAAFGAKVLEIIDTRPDLLRTVEGIGPKRVEQIIAGWHDQKEISSIMVFLQEKGVSPAYAVKIYKKYGMQATQIIIENPYRLADDIWGIGFKTADTIAQNMGFHPDSVKRIRSGILFAIKQEVGNGHVYVELENLKTVTVTLLELDATIIAAKLKMAFHELHDQQVIKLISYQDIHYVTLSHLYFTEKAAAQKIRQLIEYPSSCSFPIDAVYNQLRTASLQLNEQQQTGIIAALQNKVTIITGGPGTGKTTLIKQLLGVIQAHRYRAKLAAPTGRAAKRMSESTGYTATTLHRLLEFDPGSMSFLRTEQRAIEADFIIVDESSMLDLFLTHALLKATPLPAHLIFIGDTDQLPSVGTGNVLHDIISSNVAANIRLTEIFRQAHDSTIITNAHRINRGEFPINAPAGSRPDFIYIKEENPEHLNAHLDHIFRNGLPRYGISTDNTMVLVPMNRGSIGTQTINQTLQTMLNKTDHPGIMAHGTVYKPGDRVMQIRNNYDKYVFNGDIGTINAVDEATKQITVDFFGTRVVYEAVELDELTLAYAITIHKSQGSEYDAVIIPLFMHHFTMLARNLIYTAITRAKKWCIFIGQPRAIAMAIKNNKNIERVTFLQQFLTTDLACR